MRVLVAGAGAIGMWLGGRLAAAGHEPELLLRARHKKAIEASGLHVRGGTLFHGRLPCVTEPGGARGAFDAAIVTCKAHDTARMADRLAPLLGRGGVAASLQNGLGNGEKLRRALGDRVAVCLTSHGVTVEAPGRVFHAGAGPTHVGPVPGGADAAARRIAMLLGDAGLEPQWHDDVRPAVWTKAAVNAGLNPVAAVHGVRNGALLRDPALLDEATALVEEVHALSRAAGVLLPDDLAARLRRTAEATAENRCSMLQDVEARRPTEIEQITGVFIRMGRRLGHPMPASDGMYRRVKALEAMYLGEDLALRLSREEAEQPLPL